MATSTLILTRNHIRITVTLHSRVATNIRDLHTIAFLDLLEDSVVCAIADLQSVRPQPGDLDHRLTGQIGGGANGPGDEDVATAAGGSRRRAGSRPRRKLRLSRRNRARRAPPHCVRRVTAGCAEGCCRTSRRYSSPAEAKLRCQFTNYPNRDSDAAPISRVTTNILDLHTLPLINALKESVVVSISDLQAVRAQPSHLDHGLVGAVS